MLGFEAAFGQGALFWPVVIAIAGVGLLWRQADEAQRERWLDSTGRIDPFRAIFGGGGWAAYFRVFAGLSLVVTALDPLRRLVRLVPVRRAGDHRRSAGRRGLAIVVGPWALRLVHDLGAERAERVRTQERADMAAHLHDSVLQTLALIQKNSTDAPMVARLARSQERDLRGLAVRVASAPTSRSPASCARTPPIVEDTYGVVVDVVAVGDLDMTEALKPITDATREALTNAAKHAGIGRASTCTPKCRPRPSTCSSATGAPASTPAPSPTTARASVAASSTGWPGTAARARSAPRPATAPKCGSTCR